MSNETICPVTEKALDDFMVSIAGEKHNLPGGMEEELKRLLPLTSYFQRQQLLAWAVHVFERTTVDIDEPGAREIAASMAVFTCGVEIGIGLTMAAHDENCDG